MKRFFFLLLLTLAIGQLFAQVSPRQTIAIFAPLYLDSAFEGSTYKFGKSFPKLLNPGLEFYQGAQLALDSLQKKSAPLEVFIYDSRSRKIPLVQRLNSPELRNLEMIIAHANSTDVKILAEEARKRKIPFISATFPNDAGVTNNPYFVILNTTLRSHCEGLYGYIQKYHSRDNVILFRKNGAQENQIRDYFNEVAASSTSPLKITIADLSKGIDVNTISPLLDSTRRNICIAGSLDESFGVNLTQAISSLGEIYTSTVIGMPTWEGIKQFSGNEFKNVEIVYSSPFGASRTSSLGSKIASQFEESINSRPTDMFFRGYETVLRFALLLLDTKKDVVSNLTRKGNYVFTPFDIQPVFLNKSTMTLDYFENKYLYFIKYNNGSRSLVKL